VSSEEENSDSENTVKDNRAVNSPVIKRDEAAAFRNRGPSQEEELKDGDSDSVISEEMSEDLQKD
jgi:hypothetical protein